LQVIETGTALIRCARCVMDTTDPSIVFDEVGVCNHCDDYDRGARLFIYSGEESKSRLAGLVEAMRADGRGKPYDCVIGLSGGVDSSYVALRVKELGLRAIAVHLDNGWDSELAVKNIENVVARLNIDLHTHVLDWEEFRDLQVAFLRASTPDSEIPSDHAIVTLLVKTAQKFGLKYIISGFNQRTESHLPPTWSQGHYDARYIRSVHAKFGTRPLRTFPTISFLKARQFLTGGNRIDLLNYFDYTREEALERLKSELGWQSYGGKHHESIYTRFYQGYILPRKFGYDKRKCHLSSLICAGLLSREEALAELQEQPYPLEQQEADREYVVKKLGLTDADFEAIMKAPPRSFWDFDSYAKMTRSPNYVRARSVYRSLVKKR
jgi:N-acetyl sugar amidotransferase